MIHADYLDNQLNGTALAGTIDEVVATLEKVKDKFDVIAFRGMSGALVAPAVAARLGKDLIMVRKTTDNSHSYLATEGRVNCKSFVIIDDFAQSGETVRTIFREVLEFVGRYGSLYSSEMKRQPKKPELLGIIFYKRDTSSLMTPSLFETRYGRLEKSA